MQYYTTQYCNTQVYQYFPTPIIQVPKIIWILYLTQLQYTLRLYTKTLPLNIMVKIL